MEIYINGKLAALKQGTSFEYVAENRLFSGSDGYTLSIVFPLRGCMSNIDIFGNINRQDVVAGKIIFDCEIRDRSFCKFGSITITEINEAEVKTQFLEGRSEQNFDLTFDKIYINELDLGSWPSQSSATITPDQAISPTQNGDKYVALPWVNDASGNIQNCTKYIAEERNNDGTIKTRAHYEWDAACHSLSWQPYLLWITRKICEAIGYSIDLSDWEANEQTKYLLICNTLPASWYVSSFARALPHWTVEEYFQKLELLLFAEFDIDHRAKRISFAFTKNRLNALTPVCIYNIVDQHSTEVKVEEQSCDYTETKNLVYKDCDHSQWKFYSCDWFIRSLSPNLVKRHSNLDALLNATRSLREWSGSTGRDSLINYVHYVENLDMYFAVRAVNKILVQKNTGITPNRYKYDTILQPINSFGGRIVDDSENAPKDEIEFVPVRIDFTDATYGHCMFLSCNGFDENSDTSTGRTWMTAEEYKAEKDARFYNSHPIQTLESGEKDKGAEYYDRIYIAWWDGGTMPGGKLQRPYLEDVVIYDDYSTYFKPHCSLRINSNLLDRRGKVYNIDPVRKMTFKFLSDTIPEVRSLFLIRGKRYVCEKLTATFTENGMSRLIKGIFYPVKD